MNREENLQISGSSTIKTVIEKAKIVLEESVNKPLRNSRSASKKETTKKWAIDVNKIKVQYGGQEISYSEKVALLSLEKP